MNDMWRAVLQRLIEANDVLEDTDRVGGEVREDAEQNWQQALSSARALLTSMTTDTTEDALMSAILGVDAQQDGESVVREAVQALINYREARYAKILERLSRHLEVRHNCDNGVEELAALKAGANEEVRDDH